MSLLWKITKPKIETPSYIIGTMHIRDQRAFYLLDAIHEKIQECEAFATEFKLDEADPNEIKKYMLLPDETVIEDYIKPKRYAKIDAFLLEHIGMSLDNFRSYKPLFINNFLTESFFQEDMPLALDATLYQYAEEQGKTLLGIETYQEQLDVLTQIPIKAQVKGLWSMVKNYEEFCAEMRQLADLYQEGDIEKIYDLAHKGAEGMRNLMIHNRNKNMANRIAKMVKTQTMCIALGAAHLGGKRGVLNRLRKKGFDCVPLG